MTWVQAVQDLISIALLAVKLLVPNIAIILAAQAARWTLETWVGPELLAPALRKAVVTSEWRGSRVTRARVTLI